jgi:hypothetical protein
MIDQIATNRVVQVHLEGDLQLGAYAVNTADKHGIQVFLFVYGKESAKATNVAKDTLVECAVRQVLNALLGPVGAFNVYTSIGVGNLLVRCYLFSQGYRSIYRSGKIEQKSYFNIAERNSRKTGPTLGDFY